LDDNISLVETKNVEYSLQTLETLDNDPVEFVLWMVNENFVSVIQNCRYCQSEVNLERLSRNTDGVVWRCSRQACRGFVGVRENSFFANSNLSLRDQMKLIISFAAEGTAKSTALMLGISRRAVTDYFIACRQNYQAAILANPIVFNAGGVYEADECLIQDVKVGNNIRADIWVQSIAERVTGQIYLTRVPDRSAASLVPTVTALVPPGSYIFTDDWASYRSLPEHGYVHRTVNHSAGEYQRDEWILGVLHSIHNNTCEGVNSLVRRRLAYRSRRTLHYLDLILSEIIYRMSGRSLFDPFK
jgi:transposase-like protein